jgi:hypothetical protein
MMALVLVVAGVAASDGGMRTGAAAAPVTEPLRPDLSRDWEGTLQSWMDDDIDPARLSRGQMTIVYKGRRSTVPFALTLSAGGLARGNWGETRFHGTYRVEGTACSSASCRSGATGPPPAPATTASSSPSSRPPRPSPSPPGAPAAPNAPPPAAHRSRQALAFAVDPPGARGRLAGNTFIRRAGP